MPLKKQLGFLPLVLSGVGVILGAGIYALIGEAAGIGGYGFWLGFVVAALIAGFTGLSYAELCSMIPKAGAEFDYSRKAFGKRIGFFVAWLIIFVGTVGAATVAMGFGNYFYALTGLPVIASAIGLIALCSFIIYLGIKKSTIFASAMTLIETGGLLLIIAIGLPYFFSSGVAQKVFDFGGFQIPTILQTAGLVFFAFIGFEEIVRLAGETKNAERTVPKAVLAAIAISTLLYVLVAISAISVLSPIQLAESSAPLSEVAGTALGANAFLLLSVIALFSTGNTVLLILLATSRIIYGVAEGGELPKFLTKLDKKMYSPTAAIILSGILTMAFLTLGKISTIAKTTDFLIFIAFIIINLSVIKLRFSWKKARRPFKIPFSIARVPVTAVLGVACCALLILNFSIEIVLLGAGIAIAGIVFDPLYSRKK